MHMDPVCIYRYLQDCWRILGGKRIKIIYKDIGRYIIVGLSVDNSMNMTILQRQMSLAGLQI